MTFVLTLVLVLPAHVAGGGLRGLLLEPLQMPPPATADAAFAQMEAWAPAPAPMGAPGAPGGPSPGPAPGPAPGLPEEPKIPKITSATCAALTGKVGALIGLPGAPGPAPAPAAAMLQADAPSPAAAGDQPTVECKIYAFVSGKGAGCTCFVENPPPPFKPKVAGCPKIDEKVAVEELGVTDLVAQPPMAFGGQTGGWTRHTCVYRQWILDPQAKGLVAQYQTRLNDARAAKYITETYAASLNNAHNTAKGFWALTPVPWLKLYPTAQPPGGMAGAPGPAPWGMQMLTTTAPILFADVPTTPSPFGFGTTTGRPFGAAMPFGTPSPFGTTPSAFGTTPSAFGTTPAAFGATTAPTYAVAR